MPTTDQRMQQIITTLRETASRYGVTEAAVAELHERIEQRPLYGSGALDGTLTGLLVQIADDHRADCYQNSCRTCDNLREALAIRLADLTVTSSSWWVRLARWPR
jgi:hypothetical protein